MVSREAAAQLAPVANEIDVGQREGIGAVSGLQAGPKGDIGVQLGESTIMHVGVTAEAGVDSNVFYSNTGQTSSAMTRVVPTILITNYDRAGGSAVMPVTYSLGASLVYREYLTNNDNVQAQRAFNPTVSGILGLFSNQHVNLNIADTFARQEDPPYGESMGSIVHDYNLGMAEVRAKPGGGRLSGALRYSNTWDNYENDSLKYASNLGHDLLLDLAWNWLPKTAFYVQGGTTWISYLNPSPDRHDSFSYRALGGMRGLITAKLIGTIGIGYGNASYSGGVSGPTGATTVQANVGLMYQLTPFNRVGLTYQHGFRNSPVIGNFYGVDAVALSLDQAISRLNVGLVARYEFRQYQGITVGGVAAERNDNVVIGGAHADVFVSRWFYAGVVYALTVDDTNANGMLASVIGANYVKHQILGRVGVLY